jgi:hypothetical protein
MDSIAADSYVNGSGKAKIGTSRALQTCVSLRSSEFWRIHEGSLEESTRGVFYLVKIKNHSFPCILARYNAFRVILRTVL